MRSVLLPAMVLPFRRERCGSDRLPRVRVVPPRQNTVSIECSIAARLGIRRDIICADLDISGVTVARTVIDLDDELVASVAKELGTSTKKDTVNAALREVLANRRRAVALTRLRDAAADGAVDLAVLQDKQRYRR
jgi:Arc/MetJ family transcription regulator